MKNKNRIHMLRMTDEVEQMAMLLSGISDALLLSEKNTLSVKTAHAFGLILEREVDRIYDMSAEIKGVLSTEHEK